jgi:peptide/nickel transport system substrate-binding protein
VQTFSVAYRSDAVWNETGVQNEELDAVVAEALTIADPDARRDVMADAQRIMQEEGITIQPFWRSLYNARKENLVGAEATLNQMIDARAMYWSA